MKRDGGIFGSIIADKNVTTGGKVGKTLRFEMSEDPDRYAAEHTYTRYPGIGNHIVPMKATEWKPGANKAGFKRNNNEYYPACNVCDLMEEGAAIAGQGPMAGLMASPAEMFLGIACDDRVNVVVNLANDMPNLPVVGGQIAFAFADAVSSTAKDGGAVVPYGKPGKHRYKSMHNNSFVDIESGEEECVEGCAGATRSTINIAANSEDESLKYTREKSIIHLHFGAWPNEGLIPSSALYNFIITIKKELGKFRVESVPFIHCRDGVGRTGIVSTCLSVARYIDAEKLTEYKNIQSIVDATIAMGMGCRGSEFIQDLEQYHAVLTFAHFYLKEHQRLQTEGSGYRPGIIDMQHMEEGDPAKAIPSLTQLIAKEKEKKVPAYVVVQGSLRQNLEDQAPKILQAIREARSLEKGLGAIGLYDTRIVLLADDDRKNMVQTCQGWCKALFTLEENKDQHVQGHQAICKIVDKCEDDTRGQWSGVYKKYDKTGGEGDEFVDTPCMEALLLTHANRSNAVGHTAITPFGSTELLASFLHMTNGDFLRGEDIKVPLIPLAPSKASMAGPTILSNNTYNLYEYNYGITKAGFEDQYQISSQECLKRAVDVRKHSELVADLYLGMEAIEQARAERKVVAIPPGLTLRMEVAMALDHHVRVANLDARMAGLSIPFEEDTEFTKLVERYRDAMRWDIDTSSDATDLTLIIPLKSASIEKQRCYDGKKELLSYKDAVSKTLITLKDKDLLKNANQTVRLYWQSEFKTGYTNKVNVQIATKGMESVVETSANKYGQWRKGGETKADLVKNKVSMFFYCMGRIDNIWGKKDILRSELLSACTNACAIYNAIDGYAEIRPIPVKVGNGKGDVGGDDFRKGDSRVNRSIWAKLMADSTKAENNIQAIVDRGGSRKTLHPDLEAYLLDKIVKSVPMLEGVVGVGAKEETEVEDARGELQRTLELIRGRSPDLYHRNLAEQILRDTLIFPTYAPK